MADATYQPKVYRKQGGDEMVVADGGQITAESGSEIELESGSKIACESGGEIEGASGGIGDFQSGFLFYFADTSSFTADKLKYTLYSLNTRTTPWGDSGTNLSGGSVITPAYGYHILSLATGMSLANWQLPTANVGARLHIDGSGMEGDANVLLYASHTAGVSVACIGTASVLLSSINLSAAAEITLVCFDAGVWAIVDHNANATPQPIA